MKVSLITNSKINELRTKVENTEIKELVYKLHSSYNAIKIYANELKRKNNELTRCTEREYRIKRQTKQERN